MRTPTHSGERTVCDLALTSGKPGHLGQSFVPSQPWTDEVSCDWPAPPRSPHARAGARRLRRRDDDEDGRPVPAPEGAAGAR